MNFAYVLLLSAFLAFPVIAYVFAERFDFLKHRKLWRSTCFTFAVYDFFLLFGISFSGDFFDYILLAIQYFLVCAGVFSLFRIKSTWTKILGIIGSILIGFGFIGGLFGILLFIPISQDYVSDKKYNFTFETKSYQTRRYVFGFATTGDTRYSFQTYQAYVFPIERKVNETDFFSSKTELDFEDASFSVAIVKNPKGERIRFSTDTSSDYRHIW